MTAQSYLVTCWCPVCWQGGGGSKKAARIIEENKAKKAEKVEGEGMDAWATVDAKIMDWLRKADWSDLIQGPLEWLDQYASKHQTPELLQVWVVSSLFSSLWAG
jgi:hypothetical protein